jgi:hypothetical protein
MAKSEFLGIFLLISILSLGVFSGAQGGAGGSLNIGTQTLITNAAPIVSAVVLNGGNPIILTPGGTTSVSASFQVTDYNGCADVFTAGNVTSTFHRTSVSGSCGGGKFDCYVTSTIVSHSCAGTSTTANATATVNLYFIAGATDASSTLPGGTWEAQIIARDASNATGTASSTGVELNTLLAIDATTSTLSYGTVSAGQNTGATNSTMNLFLAGNSSATLQISGTALSSGGVAIPTSSQHYATSTFTYGGVEKLLSDTATAVSNYILKFGTQWLQTGAGNFLPGAVAANAGASYRNYLYSIGGTGSSDTVTSTVNFVFVNASGTLAGWNATTPLPNPTTNAAAEAYNGYLYVLGGGQTSSTATSTVWYAPLSATGSVGAWTGATALPAGISLHKALAMDGYMYVMGGRSAVGTVTSTVISAPINTDGTLGSWTNTTALPGPRYYHAAASYKRRIYTTGGWTGSAATSTVFFATPNAGAISSWSTTTPMTVDLLLHGLVADGNYMIAAGGLTSVIFPSSLTFYALMDSNGFLSPWSLGNPLPQTQYGQGVGVTNGYAFSYGGLMAGSSNPTSTVFGASLSSRDLYWGLEVPAGTSIGTYTGTITATAIFTQ